MVGGVVAKQVTFTRLVHPQNAHLPIFVSEEGSVIDGSAAQSVNATCPMDVISSDNVTAVNSV